MNNVSYVLLTTDKVAVGDKIWVHFCTITSTKFGFIVDVRAAVLFRTTSTKSNTLCFTVRVAICKHIFIALIF